MGVGCEEGELRGEGEEVASRLWFWFGSISWFVELDARILG